MIRWFNLGAGRDIGVVFIYFLHQANLHFAASLIKDVQILCTPRDGELTPLRQSFPCMMAFLAWGWDISVVTSAGTPLCLWGHRPCPRTASQIQRYDGCSSGWTLASFTSSSFGRPYILLLTVSLMWTSHGDHHLSRSTKQNTDSRAVWTAQVRAGLSHFLVLVLEFHWYSLKLPEIFWGFSTFLTQLMHRFSKYPLPFLWQWSLHESDLCDIRNISIFLPRNSFYHLLEHLSSYTVM